MPLGMRVGWNVTSTGWQVTLCDPMWCASSGSGVATSVSELLYPCYFTLLLYFRPRPRPHCVTWGPRSPSPKKGHSSPQCLAHVCCGQTAGWTKMPLGMEVGLSLGDCVRWGPSPYPKRGGAPPNFRPTSIVAKRLHRCHLVRR